MRRFGLLGKTLEHSFSKKYFTQKFEQEHIADCVYDNFELDSIDHLPDLLKRMPDLAGFNITIPYKEKILPFLSQKNEVVEKTGACNCVKVKKGRLLGYNTDVAGFEQSIKPFLRPHHTNALILGTGGAAKAVQYALTSLGIAYQLVSRHSDYNCIGYEAIGEAILKTYTVIINTTPLGMYPNVTEEPPIPYEYLGEQHLLYDLIYNPEKTCFLQKGAERGAVITNGADMLQIQAEESWQIWNTP